MSDNSDYDNFDFPELTASDYIRIDSLSPRVAITVEPATPTSDNKPLSISQSQANMSLFKQFRPWKSFSVSDLAEPAWCELKKEYDLRSMKWKGLDERLTSFTSANQKTIVVNTELSVRNDQISKQGQVVHKHLERKIHPVEIQVEPATREDRHGLQLLNMITKLKVLQSGICREMPVFGMIQGFVVNGVMDAITRKPLQTPCGSIKWTHALYISDTKTRTVASMPPDTNTASSKIQLMLYKRLFDALLSRSAPFDFVSHWETLGLDTSKPFSASFLEQVEDLIICNGLHHSLLHANYLADLPLAWRMTVEELGLGDHETEPELELIYYLQKLPPRKFRRSKTASGHSVITTGPKGVCKVPSEILQDSSSSHGPELVPAVEQSMFEGYQGATDANLDHTLILDTSISDDMTIIGTKRFKYDSGSLDSHLVQVLQFWNGHRPARGVSIEHTWRCRSCEYSANCEWREIKANEALARVHSVRWQGDIDPAKKTM